MHYCKVGKEAQFRNKWKREVIWIWKTSWTNVYIFTIFTILSKHLTGHKSLSIECTHHAVKRKEKKKHTTRWSCHYFVHLHNNCYSLQWINGNVHVLTVCRYPTQSLDMTKVDLGSHGHHSKRYQVILSAYVNNVKNYNF